MAFMEPEITKKTMWVIDSNRGRVAIDYDADYELIEVLKDLAEQCPNSDITLCVESGFWARLQAPGYLDCTEWSGPFETEQEAEQELKEMYGDDNE